MDRSSFVAIGRGLACGIGTLVAAATHCMPFKPVVTPQDQVFPALVMATINMPAAPPSDRERVLGARHGLIGARLVAARDAQKVRLVVRLPGWAQESELKAVLPEAGRTYTLYPQVRWDFDRLRQLRQPLPELVEFTLEAEGEEPESLLHAVRMRSLNDAPYYISSQGGIDLSWMFAAYVNEDHPLVQQILTSALANGVTRRFDGYQSGQPEQVYRQVFAIWHTLRRRGIRYSSITATAARDDAIFSQHVRFIDESWSDAQANCVDGSVLLASVLRKIGIHPKMVLMPGHMILAFDLDERGKNTVYLETTLLGTPAPTGARQAKAGGFPGEAASLANFEAAVAQGHKRYRQAAHALALGNDPRYRVIDVQAARGRGVMPIVTKAR